MKRFPLFVAALVALVPPAVAAADVAAVPPTPPSLVTEGPTAARPWQPLSLAAWGLTDAMRAHSDQAVLGGTLHARRDRVLTAARLVLDLADDAGTTLSSEVTGLDVRFGEEVVARLDRAALVDGPRRLVVPIDPHGLGDENPFLFAFRTSRSGACRPGVPVGTWRVLEGARFDVRTETLPLPDDLGQLPLPFYDARTDDTPAVHLAFSRPPVAAELRAAALVAAYFGRVAGERRVRFAVSIGELPPDHAVVLTTTGALPDGTAVPGGGEPVLAWMDSPRTDGGPRELLVLAGRDATALEQAARRLADAAWGATLPSGPLAPVDGARQAVPALRDERARALVAEREVRLGALVVDAAALVHRGHERGTIPIAFRIAPALMVAPPDTVVFDLVYTQRTPAGASPSRIDVELNGVFVETLPAGVGGPDPGPSRRRVRLPRERLRGTNWLRLHVNALEDEGLCAVDSAALVETAVSGDSVLRLDGRPRVARLPDIDAFVHDGLPFARDASLGETTLVLPTTPHRAELETALALVAGLVAVTDRPPTGLQVTDETTLLEGGPLERDLLVVAAAGSELLRRWSDGLPLSTSGGALHARDVSATDALRELLRARWPGAEAERAGAALARLAHPVALMGRESPLARGRSVVVVTATTPDELPPTLDPAGFLAPRYPGGADLVLAGGPEVTAFLVGATYPPAGVDTLTWTLWVVSEHWVALVPALLLAAFFLALLARRGLRRIESTRLVYAAEGP